MSTSFHNRCWEFFLKRAFMVTTACSQMEMDDDENKIRKWSIFSSNPRNNAHPCLIPHPSCHFTEDGQGTACIYLYWQLHLSLLQIQTLNESKWPISDHISTPELMGCTKRGNLVPVESSFILETGSWTSPSANKTGNLLSPPHKRTKKKKRKRLALRRTLSRIHKILFFFLRTWQEHRLALKMPKITWDYGMMAH